MTKPPNGLKRLEERLMKTAMYPSFPAYLRANFDAFSKTIGIGGPDKWDQIAAWALEEKLTGGKTIKGSAAKRAYDREKLRRANEVRTKLKPDETKPETRQTGGQERLNASVPAKTEPPATTPGGDFRDAARARMRAQFKPVTIPKKE